MPSQITEQSSIEQEKQTIAKVAGLSDVADITLNDRGWDSRVYAFGSGRYFFKFPRSAKVQGGYTYEIAAIEFVAGLDTDLAAQKIRWKHPANAYFGYEGVQGVALSEVIGTLGVEQKRAIGTLLGSFLRQFHQCALPGARTMGPEDESQQIQRWYGDNLAAIRRYFTPAEQARLHTLVHKVWPSKLLSLGSEPVLSHGDLHFENILYGSNGSVGVIDFGDVAYYDRSKDFLELGNDDVIFAAALQAYGHTDQLFMDKIVIRQQMIQVINLGFHAGKNDAHNTQLTVEKIRAYL